MHGQARSFDERAQALHNAGLDEPKLSRQIGGQHHAAGHGLAMQPCAVAHAGFDGVAKGVAEVEDGAQACFLFINAHNRRLDLARPRHGMRQGCGLVSQQGRHLEFKPVQQRHVGNGPVFDDLGQAGTQLAHRQAGQGLQVADHTRGLVKGADHVLAQRVVDGGFATHRRIHLGQQRGGHLDKGHTAHVAGGGEARHVAHHTTAQRHEHGLAVTAAGEQVVKDEVEREPVLVLFAVGQQHGADLGVVGRQRLAQCRTVKAIDGGVADHHGVCRLRQAMPGPCLLQKALADEDVVVLVRGGDRDRARSGIKHGRAVYGPRALATER